MLDTDNYSQVLDQYNASSLADLYSELDNSPYNYEGNN